MSRVFLIPSGCSWISLRLVFFFCFILSVFYHLCMTCKKLTPSYQVTGSYRMSCNFQRSDKWLKRSSAEPNILGILYSPSLSASSSLRPEPLHCEFMEWLSKYTVWCITFLNGRVWARIDPCSWMGVLHWLCPQAVHITSTTVTYHTSDVEP